MDKKTLLTKIIKYIALMSIRLNLDITNNGTGKAFENSFWKDIITDDSNIPNIVAENKDYKIELRSFWGSPELDIHRYYYKDGVQHYDLQIITYSDSVAKGDTYIHSNEYYVDQVRVNCHCKNQYKEYIDEIYDIIKWIEDCNLDINISDILQKEKKKC